MMIHLGVIAVIPEIIMGLHHGVVGRAISQGLVKLDVRSLRDWAVNAYGQIDDRPYGGGAGMVIQYQPMRDAINQMKAEMPSETKVVYVSPQGKKVAQSHLVDIVARSQSLLFIAGRYEGVDERVITQYVDEEWSLGDFVLGGGEIAVMAFMDAIIRLVPGTLGDETSKMTESFMDGLLDYPQYTRPALIDGLPVPAVLLSGDRAAIERWRAEQKLERTRNKRPDLLD